MSLYWFVVLAIIAFLYSSVGHGGASGYLALMALMGVEIQFMHSTALTLNLFVAGIAFINFARSGHFKWKILVPFIITSMPFAYLGARVPIDPEIYKLILGVFLVIATVRLLIKPKESERKFKFTWTAALIIGAVLGFFSGMIGIGGGIILTPVLVILGWANMKEAAAVSAAFIFLNSGSGLLGLLHVYQLVPDIWIWIAIGLVAGLAGSYLGSQKTSLTKLRYVLACVLLVASVKLFLF